MFYSFYLFNYRIALRTAKCTAHVELGASTILEYSVLISISLSIFFYDCLDSFLFFFSNNSFLLLFVVLS